LSYKNTHTASVWAASVAGSKVIRQTAMTETRNMIFMMIFYISQKCI